VLIIDGVVKATAECDGVTQIYQQAYTPGQRVRIEERDGGIGLNLRVELIGSCDDCAAGKYSSLSNCIDCPGNSSSWEASTAQSSCACNVGYTGPAGGLCPPCVAGTYKTSIGSAACTACGAGTYSETEGASTCINCLAGKYSATGGARGCLSCPAGKYSTAIQASSEATCLSCPGNSMSITGSTEVSSCQCEAGYSGPDGGACLACAAGSHKATAGSAACTFCPAYSSSPPGSDALADCQCEAGYSGPDGGACLACAAGSYKNTTGSAACTFCGVGFYSNATATDACQACVTSKTTPEEQSVSVAQCVCKAGFGLQMTTPGTCPGGQFVPFTGTSTCSTCVNGKSLNESKLFEIESRVNSLFAPGPSEFYSHAPFLYVEGMQCQTDLTGLYFLLIVQSFNSIPVYQKLVSATTDQENIGNSKVQITYANGILVVNDLRYYRVALKSTQWSLCTGDGCPADARNPSSVAIWTELCAEEYVQNSGITMTPSYYLITDALTIPQFAMCKPLREGICVPPFLHVVYGCNASSHWKGASGVFWMYEVWNYMDVDC
jgi:hypothetical protein